MLHSVFVFALLQVGEVSVFNGTMFPRNERVNLAIPAPAGALPASTGIAIGGEICPYRAVSRWADGSVKWASATKQVSIGPYAEQDYPVEFTGVNPPGAPPLPFAAPPTLVVTVNATSYAVGNWVLLNSTPARACYWSTALVGSPNAVVRIQVFAEVFAGQAFGKLTFVVGNDALIRDNSNPIPVSPLKLRIQGGVLIPLYPNAHKVLTVSPLIEYSFPLATLGDGQRWATRFVWGAAGVNPLAFLLSAFYPLQGLPDPVWVSESGAAGLYGTLKNVSDVPLSARAAAEGSAWAWLAIDRPEPWHNLGFLLKDEGSSGPHGGWGKLALYDVYRTRAPSLLRKYDCYAITQASHRNDHYFPFRFVDHLDVSTLDGWVSPPLRPLGLYQIHCTGNHGWIGRNEAHSEAGMIQEVVELTGDEYLAQEMWQMGEFWGAYEGVDGPFDEGRSVSRPLENALRAFFVGPDCFRQDLAGRLLTWVGSKLIPNREFVDVPNAPAKRAFSIYSGAKWLTWCPEFQPMFPGYCPPSGIAYPYSEVMVASVFVRMGELFGTTPGYEGILEDMERLFVGISTLTGFRTVESDDGLDNVAGGPSLGVWGYASFRGLARRAQGNGDALSFLVLNYIADLIENAAMNGPDSAASQVWLQN
ncbi:MAG TPA: hypothetical protein VFI25_06290 [Planctomycetota bacterium]|jgi:hypothetical protein|nr:hypothetical protein [Planctomycetota bacterium]